VNAAFRILPGGARQDGCSALQDFYREGSGNLLTAFDAGFYRQSKKSPANDCASKVQNLQSTIEVWQKVRRHQP
jgi:hypothetical protein